MTMKISIPRLHSIRMKAGGASVRVLRTREENNPALLRHAKVIDEMFPEKAEGHVVIAWAADGAWSCGFRNTAKSQVASVMLPHYVAEIMRRQLGMEDIKKMIDGEPPSTPEESA